MKEFRVVYEALSKTLNEHVNYSHDDEFNWYFDCNGEMFKVRKYDGAVHYQSGNNAWEYDFDLF
ncbi:hypothetical protein [Paenibacillus sp. ISL-20]|uniref:hypothetical protein n=1 Tax=Paenibacillus sp. ISL-20 TaxID=2819163 RepID=UPI001BE6A37D|nr:hypothetical protein [Paenibacillus sp. ISL-20]MBT2759881.1 hypothetical protein [Paenibacillus sp. ISL-20]